MTEVLVAIVAGAFGLLSTLIANRARQHAKAARVQVENNHTTNLREEADERHTENVGVLGDLVSTLMEVKKEVSGVKSDIRGIRRDVGRLADSDQEQARAIRELEQTQPKGAIHG